MARSETEPEVCSYESLLRFLLRFRFGRAWNTRRRKSVTLDPSEATRPVKNCRQFEAASLAAKEGHARRSRLISASKRESFISSLVGLVSLLFFFFSFFFLSFEGFRFLPRLIPLETFLFLQISDNLGARFMETCEPSAREICQHRWAPTMRFNDDTGNEVSFPLCNHHWIYKADISNFAQNL